MTEPIADYAPDDARYLTDEQRAKVAALAAGLMEVIGDYDLPEIMALYDRFEEMHDHFRHIGGKDAYEEFPYRIEFVRFREPAHNDSSGAIQ